VALRARRLYGQGRLLRRQGARGARGDVKDPALPSLRRLLRSNSGRILRSRRKLAGEIAAKRNEVDKALLHLDRAVRLEDALVYTEPADWPSPVRQDLGAALLEAGRAVEAEAVYWDDLKRNRENGWSLFGLLQALTAQDKKDDAARVQQRFEKAWSSADVKLDMK
jgi:predicted Zn-dependent protease